MTKEYALIKAKRLTAILLVLVIALAAGCQSGLKLLSESDKDNRTEKTTTEVTESSETDVVETIPTTQPIVVSEEDQLEAMAQMDAIDIKLVENALGGDYLSMYFRMSRPDELGIEYPAPTLGIESYEDYLADLAVYEECLVALQEVNRDALNREYQIMYDVLALDLSQIQNEDPTDFYLSSPFNSITGVQSSLPLTLSQVKFASVEDANNYIELINDIPRYYEEFISIENERAEMGLMVEDKYLDLLIESCDAMLADQDTHFMITTFDDRVAAIEGITDADKTDLIARHKAAVTDSFFPAYETLKSAFEALKGKSVRVRGLEEVDGGKEYYARYFSIRTGMNITPEEGIALLDSEFEALQTELYSLAVKEGVFDAYMNMDVTMGDTAANVDFCKMVISDDFPELPEHDLILENVPTQVEEFFSPAAYFMCPIDDPSVNIIVVNNSQLSETPNLLTTIGHEGYPGHLFENVYHAYHMTTNYQKLSASTAYAEGWAEYAGEYVMTKADVNQDAARLAAIDSMYSKILVSRIDIGVNYEGWTYDDTKAYLAGVGLADKETVDQIWDIVVEIPCYYTPYCFGHLETIRILESAIKATEGKKTLLEVHEAYLDIGPAPYPILEQYMSEFVNNA
ncbi:MAG: DUF885 domain-containing protein [Clostridiaceae bacterium]|nr:DUF885 domain-containing protein [Clostridiaceae bacterium]